jgi:competence protein ComEC
VGKNTYGHPTPEVLARLKNAGAEILRNDIDGNVELTVRDGKIYRK